MLKNKDKSYTKRKMEIRLQGLLQIPEPNKAERATIRLFKYRLKNKIFIVCNG